MIKKLEDVRAGPIYFAKQLCVSNFRRLPKGKANVEVTIDVVRQGDREEFIEILKKKLIGLSKHWRRRKISS